MSNAPSCYHCGSVGHFARNCPQRYAERPTDNRACFNCGQVGHLSRDCPVRRGGGQQHSRAEQPAPSRNVVTKVVLPPRKYSDTQHSDVIPYMVYTSEAPEDIQCQICFTPWLQPLEIEPCGHHLCYECCKRIVDDRQRCAQCRGDIVNVKSAQRVLCNLVDALEVRCLKCNAVSQREAYFTHDCKPKPIHIASLEWAEKLFQQGQHKAAMEEYTLGIKELENNKTENDNDNGTLIALYTGRCHANYAMKDYARTYEDATKAVQIYEVNNADDTDDVIAGQAYFLRAAGMYHQIGDAQLGPKDVDSEVKEEIRSSLRKSIELNPQSCLEAKGLLAHLELPTSGMAPPSIPVEEKPVSKSMSKAAKQKAKKQQQQKEQNQQKEQQQPTTSSQPQQQQPPTRISQHILENTWSMLRECWRDFGGEAVKDYEALTPEKREANLRKAVPFIVPRVGATMDISGEDCHHMAYLCPEINITGLCKTTTGLRELIVSVANKPNMETMIFEHVKEIFESMQQETPRQKYFASFDKGELGDVVDSRTGEVCDTVITASSPIEAQNQLANMVRRKVEAVWVPRYIRELALDRLYILCDFLLKVLVSAGGELNGKTLRPLSCTTGCFLCGKKFGKVIETCTFCKVAHYCSKGCLDMHKTVGHKCNIASGGIEEAVRKLHENLSATMGQRDYKEEMTTYRRLCNQEINSKDVFGDGDQSPLPFPKKITDDGQLLRSMWASGLDFDPRRPGCKNTELFRKAYEGDEVAVKSILLSFPESDRKQLVNLRETLMRFTPLHACIAGARGKDVIGGGNFLEVAKLLIEAGSNVDAKDFCGFSCVHHCATAYASHHSLEILFLLVDAGANPNPRNRLDEIPLLEPLQAQRIDTVKALLQVGCDPNAKCGSLPMTVSQLCVMLPTVHAVILACAPMAGVKVGEKAVFHGLVGKPHLNGSLVTIRARLVGKYQVQIDGTCDEVIAKMENLQRPSEGCKKCGKVSGGTNGSALLRCTRCKGVVYCSKECQQSDWPTHKTSCGVVQPIILYASDRDTSKEYHFDITSGMGHHSSDPQTLQVGTTFPIKIQVCVNRTTMTPIPDGPMVIYNKEKTMNWTVDKKKMKEPKSFDRLYDMVTKSGVAGLKVYVECKALKDGCIEIAPTPLPPQPW